MYLAPVIIYKSMTHILEVQTLEREMHLDDSSSFDARSQNILLRRDIIVLRYTVKCIKVVRCRVVKLVFPATRETELHSRVLP